MPWDERSTVSLRKEFVLRALAKEESITELCQEFKISRKTGHKWINRFKERGFDALVDESRRPRSSPIQISGEATVEIIKLRKQHPTWGPRKLYHVLARHLPREQLPSERSIRRVLERSNLTRRRRYRQSCYGGPTQPPRFTVEQPNDLWTVDFKGWWRTKDGERCDPLTIRDAHSRMVLALRLLDRTNGIAVRAVFEELFEQYGLPKAIQSDNGPPFVSMRTLAGLTKLSAWWVSMGIQLVRSRPGCPQDNGGHERMHADIRVELQARAADNRQAQQVACDEWRVEFNHVRPHEALGYKTPAEVYRPSSRRASHVIMGGFPDGCDLRTASSTGQVGYFDRFVYVSNALAGHQIGLMHVGDIVQIWFHELLIGWYDPKQTTRHVSAMPIQAQDLSPRNADRTVLDAEELMLGSDDLPLVTAEVVLPQRAQGADAGLPVGDEAGAGGEVTSQGTVFGLQNGGSDEDEHR